MFDIIHSSSFNFELNKIENLPTTYFKKLTIKHIYI